MKVVDTSYWVALLFSRDQRHQQARAIWGGSLGALLSTNHILGETWTFLRRRAGHPAAVSFLDAIGSSNRVSIVHVDEQTEAEALAWLRRHDEREYSFVDATSESEKRSRSTETFRQPASLKSAFEKAGQREKGHFISRIKPGKERGRSGVMKAFFSYQIQVVLQPDSTDPLYVEPGFQRHHISRGQFIVTLRHQDRRLRVGKTDPVPCVVSQGTMTGHFQFLRNNLIDPACRLTRSQRAFALQ